MADDTIEGIGRANQRNYDSQIYSTRSTPAETKPAVTDMKPVTLAETPQKTAESSAELSREAQQSSSQAEEKQDSTADFRNSWLDALRNRSSDYVKESRSEDAAESAASSENASKVGPTEEQQSATEEKQTVKNAQGGTDSAKDSQAGTMDPEKAADGSKPSKEGSDGKSALATAGDWTRKGLDMVGLPALGDAVKNNVLTGDTVNDIKKLVGMDGASKSGNSQEMLDRALNLAKLGLDIPELRRIGTDVKENGFSKENVESLKELLPDIKNVITPENMKLLKDINPNALDKVFTPEVKKELTEKFPKLAERLNFENMDKFKNNLTQLQSGLTKDNIAGIMNQLSPWVRTSQGEGTLNMLDRMVGDPAKLGGADKNLSTEDFTQIARGVLNTQTGQQFRDEMLLQNVPQITHSLLTGRELQSPRRIERRLNIARNQATPERISSEIKNRQNLVGSAGLPESTVPRSFTENEVQSLIDAGKRAQQMGFGPADGCNGQDGQESVNNLMSQVMEPLKRSINPKDGISQQEVHNIAEVGNMAYDVMGSVYLALGGQYR